MQSTQEIANRLVELCRTWKNKEAYKELFAENAVAIEMDYPNIPSTEGKAALLAKNDEFGEKLVEFHGSEVSDPIVAGPYFSVRMTLDATYKEDGRMNVEEICLYKVEDGKIVSEQFFY